MTIVWAGLALGAIYGLVALGYNIIFSASGAFNFAHAQLLVLGMFVAYWGIVTLRLPTVLVFLVAGVIVAAVAVVEERVAIRPVKTLDGQLVTTVGAATLIAGISQLIWGSQALQVPFFAPNGSLVLLGGIVQPADLWLIGAAVVMGILTAVVCRRTMIGLALLAVAEDREAALLRGVDVRTVVLFSFAAAGLTAGLVAPFVGPKTFAITSLGTPFALYGFVALAIGGFGSFVGGIVGGFAVGLSSSIAGYYFGGQYQDLAVFAILILVLLIRPAGLFVSVRERMV